MNIDFFSPVSDSIATYTHAQPSSSLGHSIKIYFTDSTFPDLTGVKLAILGVEESRGGSGDPTGEGLYDIRKELYQLFGGNWKAGIADLGNIKAGHTIEDTYFAVSSVLGSLLKQNIVPIVLGGSQDITYAMYRAYDAMEQTVNIAAVDSRFDIGSEEEILPSRSFLSKIILEKPNNLFNYSNIGYQTYLNSQEEITLLDSLYFDAFRLGEVKDITQVEPILRDADVVSLDLGSVRQSDAPGNRNASPNGFFGNEACAIARYAGISDKVSSFGVFEYCSHIDNNKQTAKLIAQILWYFMEGFNQRAFDYPYATKESYEKYTVLLEDDDPLNFYKSDKSGRWWMEINVISNNKHKRHALIPCNYHDYEQALQRKIPNRWFKALQKLV